MVTFRIVSTRAETYNMRRNYNNQHVKVYTIRKNLTEFLSLNKKMPCVMKFGQISFEFLHLANEKVFKY